MSEIAGIIEGFRTRSGDQSLLDRLDDFRGRLITSLIVLFVTTLIGFYVVLRWGALGLIVRPIEPFLAGEKLEFLSPADPFYVTLKLAVLVGMVLALPFLLAQVWGLLAPLMRPEEKKLVGPAIVGAVLLFAAGIVFCYLTALPLLLRFTMGFQSESLEQSIVIGEYFSTVRRLMLAFGLSFELPIVILLATVLGLVTPEFLVSKRRHAIAIMTIVGAFVTPPELVSLLLLLIPMLLLYEASILLSRVIVRRRGPAAEPGR